MDPLLEPPGGPKPVDTLISDFQPSELGENRFLSQTTQFVVICYNDLLATEANTGLPVSLVHTKFENPSSEQCPFPCANTRASALALPIKMSPRIYISSQASM